MLISDTSSSRITQPTNVGVVFTEQANLDRSGVQLNYVISTIDRPGDYAFFKNDEELPKYEDVQKPKLPVPMLSQRAPQVKWFLYAAPRLGKHKLHLFTKLKIFYQNVNVKFHHLFESIDAWNYKAINK